MTVLVMDVPAALELVAASSTSAPFRLARMTLGFLSSHAGALSRAGHFGWTTLHAVLVASRSLGRLAAVCCGDLPAINDVLHACWLRWSK